MDEKETFDKAFMNDELVKWIMQGLEIARKENKTLEQMVSAFEASWHMGALFGFFPKGEFNNGK